MNIIAQPPMKWESYSARIDIGDDSILVRRDTGTNKVRLLHGGDIGFVSIHVTPADARLIARMLIEAADKE